MVAMKYLSVCSGIEAATVAWGPLGWEAVAYAEIEPFASAVLAHYYPGVPNLGDFTKIEGDEFGKIDIIVGGTPCQTFSIAGRREGLDDERGDLTLEFIRLAGRLRPRWLVWENVPGLLSHNGGRTFGIILGLLAECGYGFAYRVLDAQYFGIPQRRRRVFVVGYFGDWRPAAAVLFERHSLSWNPAPSRGSANEDASPPKGRPGSCGRGRAPVISRPLTARNDHRNETQETYITQVVTPPITGPPYGDNASRESLLFTPLDMRQATREFKERSCHQPGSGIGQAGDPAFTLSGGQVQAIAFHGSQDPDVSGGVTHPVGGNQGQECCIAFMAGQGAKAGSIAASEMQKSTVRRLTPRECERLQGFPDDYTLIDYKGKPAKDGPRYKAIGNSMAVPVMRWIGERIQSVAGLIKPV
jgi:DNA (cytosine-5)-methyltransferase 1